MNCFSVSGVPMHVVNSAHAPPGVTPTRAQLFFLDPTVASEVRQNFTNVDAFLMRELEAEIRQVSPHFRQFLTFREELERQLNEPNQPPPIGIRLTAQVPDRAADRMNLRRYDAATSSEVYNF
jgi:hypothetical protein